MSHEQVDGFFNIVIAPTHLGFFMFNMFFTITFYIVIEKQNLHFRAFYYEFRKQGTFINNRLFKIVKLYNKAPS
jgi:hypothetical protein